MNRNAALVAFLIVSGLLAAAIGAAVTLTPLAFAASNGIQLSTDPSLLSEVRAPGGALLACGLLILAGAAVRELRFSASLIAAAVYLPYGLARLVSLLIDGVPAEGLLAATAIELVIGALALIAVRESRPTLSASRLTRKEPEASPRALVR
jgi:uncharacterized protein DUF4345